MLNTTCTTTMTLATFLHQSRTVVQSRIEKRSFDVQWGRVIVEHHCYLPGPRIMQPEERDPKDPIPGFSKEMIHLAKVSEWIQEQRQRATAAAGTLLPNTTTSYQGSPVMTTAQQPSPTIFPSPGPPWLADRYRHHLHKYHHRSPGRVSSNTLNVVGLTKEKIQAGIPPNASKVVWLYGRRVQLDYLANSSMYSLLRAWVRDDPWLDYNSRELPPTVGEIRRQLRKRQTESRSESTHRMSEVDCPMSDQRSSNQPAQTAAESGEPRNQPPTSSMERSHAPTSTERSSSQSQCHLDFLRMRQRGLRQCRAQSAKWQRRNRLALQRLRAAGMLKPTTKGEH